MKTRFILTFFACILISFPAYSQTSSLSEFDKNLTECYRAFRNSDYLTRKDSLGSAFRDKLLNGLRNPITLNSKFDSLSKYISIKASPDKRLKFYCWNNLSGGTFADIHTIAQYLSDNDEIFVQQLYPTEVNSEENWDQSLSVSEIHEYTNKGRKHYFTIGWGTSGGGKQHQSIRIFMISNSNLLRCDSCLLYGTTYLSRLTIEYPRGAKLDLSYKTNPTQFSYNEFLLNEYGIYSPSGKRVTFKLSDGIYKVVF